MAFPDPIIMPATGIGNKNMTLTQLHGPASYTTGGVTVGVATFNLQKADWVTPMDTTTDGLNYIRIVSVPIAGSASTVKILWFVVATGVEVVNGTNLSAKRVMCMGIGT